MRKLVIAMLATAAIGTPAMAQNAPASPKPSSAQEQQAQQQKYRQPQANNNQGQQQQQAQNQPIQPRDLSRREVRQVQTALNNNGDHVGRIDGRWGSKTEGALNKFQQSKGIQANGQLDQQTVADLGLNADQFNRPSNKNKGS